MRQPGRGSRFHGRVVIGVLLVATVVAALAAPVGLRGTAAQDIAIQTRVQIVHASPDLGKVELHINNEEVLDEFEYGDQSDWINLDPGTVRFTITVDRAGVNYAIFDVAYPVPAGNDYYLVITDALVLGGVFDRSPIPDGGARVRVTHASVDLPAVNVVASGTDRVFAAQLGYGQASQYTSVPAGTYDLEFRLADTGEVALSAPGIVLEGNKVYDLVVIGVPGDDDHPLEVRPLVDDTEERDGGTPPA
jgi:hypothetical protein